ncbi:siderophore-interacting protein [Longispora albida]|uniref:siderophore-interacting protein n=1 Tax=Longispora albida TaxID=203523 RepID=UPI000360C134|nr:siderophore-interacting protein [Longispora albida]
MSDGKKKVTVHRATVLHTERLTPHMIRVTLGGGTLGDFSAGEYTDHYVKLVFPLPGVDYPQPFDIAEVRATMGRELWPRIRTYTVRSWDQVTRELVIDFVHHGDEGIAGPWAAAARPGDELMFMGPGGGYAPSPDAAWHLLAGDESALPAIGAALEGMPAGARALVFAEVAGPEDEQKLLSGGGIEIFWLHRGERPIGEALLEAVRALDFPEGQVQAFVHGEANFVRDLRRFLRFDKGVDRANLSISGYWRRGADEDAWQATKQDYNRDPDEAAKQAA